MRSASIAIGVLVAALIGGAIGAYLVMQGGTRAPDAQNEAAQAKAEAARVAREKALAEEQAARAKAESERIAREKALAEQEAARAKAEADRVAREKAAAEKAVAEETARVRAETERVAREKAAADKARAEAAAREKAAAEKARAEAAAREKAEAERIARENAAAARARAKAAADKKEAERLAMRKEKAKVAPRNDGETFTYYRDLAHGGNADAALMLGEMYEAGRGVAPSNNWAYLWYSIAERRGATAARTKKDTVAGKLQAVEIEQIDRQVQNMVGAK